MVAEATLVKAEDLEVLARKSLVAESARAKLMISRRIGEILSRLEDPTVTPRSAAQALGALAPILRLLYRWDDEPSLAEMQRARTGAINLELINMSPEQMAGMPERGKPGCRPLETEQESGREEASAGAMNGQHPAGYDKPSPKKEASTLFGKASEPTSRGSAQAGGESKSG